MCFKYWLHNCVFQFDEGIITSIGLQKIPMVFLRLLNLYPLWWPWHLLEIWTLLPLLVMLAPLSTCVHAVVVHSYILNPWFYHSSSSSNTWCIQVLSALYCMRHHITSIVVLLPCHETISFLSGWLALRLYKICKFQLSFLSASKNVIDSVIHHYFYLTKFLHGVYVCSLCI